ncbi:pirin family protein [Burkholderia sp. MSMB1835]|uniref:pirin family protein n=1 Tax=Burkholderia sp. MSMB1835 TaxID=1637876 RepID=UPI0007566E2C|nr:pirin family protein [Burkholderia sp. MSMB1835]KVL37378.1 pirin [Burkholderia sp. MSMB1835]
MNPVLNITPLGFPWVTADPFLMCVYHDDHYPKANGRYGPAASLTGHQLGQDFFNADGWRMYHGMTVPGFPAHPHRGFETVTLVRRGLIDHADSLGAAARYGAGDVQWLTAGRGVVHSEMFPLLNTEAPNALELFQIWLNLPARSKFVAPQFTMFWADDIPRHRFTDASGANTEVVWIAGPLYEGSNTRILRPPPASWAAAEGSDVAIWTVTMEPGARWILPPAGSASTRRNLYFFAGGRVTIGPQEVDQHARIELRADQPTTIVNGDATAEFLLLQGRPIGEPVAQMGPFVMNTEQEVQQAFADYRRTQFGGWPWPDEAPVHGADPTRFAKYAKGTSGAEAAVD